MISYTNGHGYYVTHGACFEIYFVLDGRKFWVKMKKNAI